MSEDAAFDVMEALHSCRCCLRRAPDKDLKTPYTQHGNTEIYLDMLEECFNIRLNEGGEECGICSLCLGRLRDASDFKMQVQRSQAELRARLERALQAIDLDEELAFKLKVEDSGTSTDTLDVEPLLKTLPEVEEKDGASEDWCSALNAEPPVKAEVGGDDGASEDLVPQSGPAVESEASGDAASDDCASRRKRRARTRKEPKQQKSSQKRLSDFEISDNDDSLAHVYVPSSDVSSTSSSLTHISGMSKTTDLFESLPDAFQSATLSHKSTYILNTTDTEEPPLENIEPSAKANEHLPEADHDLKIENECLDGPHEVALNSYEETNIAEKEDDIEEGNEINKIKIAEEDDCDFSELSNDKNHEPSSHESSSESDHDLEIENECLDGPREVALNCCEGTNIDEKEYVSLRKFSSEDDIEKENVINKKNIAEEDILGEKRGIGKRIRERDFCFYCETFILNFARHMVRKHPAEPEVQLALSYPKNSLDRKKNFNDLRKKGNYVSNSQTPFKPVKKCRYSDKTDYLPCSKCLGFYSKKTLWRHVKTCDKTIPTNNAQSQAQNFLVRYVKVDKNLKESIFPRMRPDKISLVAKKDKLICMFGAQYLKTHREKHFATVVTRKMRELAKLLVEATKLKPNINNLEQILKPQYYDTLVHATKMVGRFNEVTQKFGAPTYAMNIATSIKQCCNIALLQSCKIEATVDTASVQADLKTLSKLIENNWKLDISSQATDDLNLKKINKTTIVPLAADLKLFKDYLCAISKQSSDNLTTENINIEAFNNLVESTYCRVLLLNRRRPGELQRLKLNDYNDHGNDSNKYEEFDKVLSPTEKMLVDRLKIIVIQGKRGRGPVLFSTEIQDDINKILSARDMHVGSDNSLLFVKAGGIAVCGYKLLEKYAKACGAKNFRALTSTRLRKHLATMTQLFTMTDTELQQLAAFMGLTLSVHKNNYRLPGDVYQTAKISKLLLLMEDGKADMYQGKALDEIELNMDEEIKGIEIGKPPSLQNVTNKTSANKKRTLVPWTAEQKNVVTKHFKGHIKHKKPPKRAECDELKNKYPTLLHNKDWLKIKVYIQNTYSKQ